jgi:diguanylate cyclase (GGDEF)-like protein
MAWKRAIGAGAAGVGTMLLVVGIVHDVTAQHIGIGMGTMFVFPVAVLMFIFALAVTMAQRFAAAFRTAEHLRVNLQQEVDERTVELRDVNERLRELSERDGLTGVANRRHFDDVLDNEWRRGTRERHQLTLIMVDVDHFKPYNDEYGHQAGDECLKRVAEVLTEGAHRAGDVVARYGGEEFAVLLPNTSLQGGERLARSLKENVERLRVTHARSEFGVVTISLGVASSSSAADGSPLALVKEADIALYRAKQLGRNRLEVCTT